MINSSSIENEYYTFFFLWLCFSFSILVSISVAVSFRSASVKVIRVFLGGCIRPVHLQLPSATHPGRAVGGGSERCTDEGPPFTSHRQQTR